MTRARLQHVVLNEEGQPQAGRAVTVLEANGVSPFGQALYDAPSGGALVTDPETNNEGLIELYADLGQRVTLAVSGDVGLVASDFFVDQGTAVVQQSSVPVVLDDDLTVIGDLTVSGDLQLAQRPRPEAPEAGLTTLYATSHLGLGVVPSQDADGRLLFDTASLGWVSVTHHGAVGDNVADDTAAIVAAYAAIPASGGVLYFPPGHYRHGNLSFTDAKPFAIVGAGPQVTTLVSTTSAGAAITVNGPTIWGMHDIALFGAGRAASSYAVSGLNITSGWVVNVVATLLLGGVFCFEACNQIFMRGCRLHATDGTTGDTCLRLIGTSATVTDSIFQTGSTAIGRSPTVWLGGGSGSNSLRFANCIFGGGGPRFTHTINTIAGFPTTFTVAVNTAHGLEVDDLIAIRDCSTAAYNNQWRVASIIDLYTFTVTSSIAAGNVVAAAGTVQSVAAAFMVENSTGPWNESQIVNCLFSAVATPIYGSAAIVFDGRAGTFEIQGWQLTGNWYDYGRTGILIMGQSSSSSCTTYGFSITGGTFAELTRSIHLDRVRGVTISGVHAGIPIFAGLSDGVSASCGLYIFAGTGAPPSSGISVSASHLGIPRDFAAASGSLFAYGLLVDGPVESLVVDGSVQLGGGTKPMGVLNVSAAVLAPLEWKIAPGLVTTALPMTAGSVLPGLSSAASITLDQGYDTFQVSGTTTITTINGGYHGRAVTLLFLGALQLGTGGNLAVVAARTILAGDAVTLVFHGALALWFAR